MRMILCGPRTAPLRTRLAQAGFAVTEVDDADEAVSVLRHDEYDLVLLHCPPGAGDGCRGIRALRGANLATPALVLCADAQRHAVSALTHGADDVVDLATPAEELAAAGAANLITTVWGAGYRMDDQVAA